MQILSLNKEHTTGSTQIAFNVDSPLAPDVFKRVNAGVYKLTLEGNVLKCSWSISATGGITPVTISSLNAKFTAAEQEAMAAEAEKAAEHDSLMRSLSQQTKLPID